MKKWILSPLAAAFFLIGCNRVEDRVQPVDLTNKVDQPKLVVWGKGIVRPPFDLIEMAIDAKHRWLRG